MAMMTQRKKKKRKERETDEQVQCLHHLFSGVVVKLCLSAMGAGFGLLARPIGQQLNHYMVLAWSCFAAWVALEHCAIRLLFRLLLFHRRFPVDLSHQIIENLVNVDL